MDCWVPELVGDGGAEGDARYFRIIMREESHRLLSATEATSVRN